MKLNLQYALSSSARATLALRDGPDPAVDACSSRQHQRRGRTALIQTRGGSCPSKRSFDNLKVNSTQARSQLLMQLLTKVFQTRCPGNTMATCLVKD